MTIDTTRRLREKKKKQGPWHLPSDRQPVMSDTLDWRDSSSRRCLLWFSVCDTRRRRGGTSHGPWNRWKGTEGVQESRLRSSATSTAFSVPTGHGIQRPLCVTTFPCVCICSRVESTKSRLAGARLLPELSVHDWETECEVMRQDGTIRGSWAFPFRWTTFCWSAVMFLPMF